MRRAASDARILLVFGVIRLVNARQEAAERVELFAFSIGQDREHLHLRLTHSREKAQIGLPVRHGVAPSRPLTEFLEPDLRTRADTVSGSNAEL